MLSDREGKPQSPERHKDENILLGLGGVDEAVSELFKQNQNFKKGGAISSFHMSKKSVH